MQDEVPPVHCRVAEAAHDRFDGDDTGHDVAHLWRVYRLGRRLADSAGADFEVVGAAALVHDLHRVGGEGRDERSEERPSDGRAGAQGHASGEEGPSNGFVHPRETLPEVREILAAAEFPAGKRGAVCHCVEHHEEYDFASEGSPDHELTPEEQVLRDADNLDALGAIGIARAVTFGAAHGQALYDPDREVRDTYDRANRDNTVIQHAREKLLRLPETMETELGRELAAERAAFVEQFVERFEAEWRGDR